MPVYPETVWALSPTPDSTGLPTPPAPADIRSYQTKADPIAVGGAATLHRLLPEPHGLIAKLYNDKYRATIAKDPTRFDRVVTLTRHQGDLKKRLPFVVWPRALLFGSKASATRRSKPDFLGFSMDYVPGTHTLERFISTNAARFNLTGAKSVDLMLMLSNALALLHAHPLQIRFGDFSSKNLLIKTDYSRLLFIDSESFQYTTQQTTYLPLGVTPMHTSPGISRTHDKPVGVAHDNFILAIHLFTMLMAHHGRLKIQPFSPPQLHARTFPLGDPKAQVNIHRVKTYALIPAPIRQAFLTSFTTPTPLTARQWHDLIKANEKTLIASFHPPVSLTPKEPVVRQEPRKRERLRRWNPKVLEAQPPKPAPAPAPKKDSIPQPHKLDDKAKLGPPAPEHKREEARPPRPLPPAPSLKDIQPSLPPGPSAGDWKWFVHPTSGRWHSCLVVLATMAIAIFEEPPAMVPPMRLTAPVEIPPAAPTRNVPPSPSPVPKAKPQIETKVREPVTAPRPQPSAAATKAAPPPTQVAVNDTPVTTIQAAIPPAEPLPAIVPYDPQTPDPKIPIIYDGVTCIDATAAPGIHMTKCGCEAEMAKLRPVFDAQCLPIKFAINQRFESAWQEWIVGELSSDNPKARSSTEGGYNPADSLEYTGLVSGRFYYRGADGNLYEHTPPQPVRPRGRSPALKPATLTPSPLPPREIWGYKPFKNNPPKSTVENEWSLWGKPSAPSASSMTDAQAPGAPAKNPTPAPGHPKAAIPAPWLQPDWYKAPPPKKLWSETDGK